MIGRMKGAYPSTENVIRAWQGSRTVREAAGKLDITPGSLYRRAVVLRERGVALKVMLKAKTTEEEFIVIWNRAANLKEVAREYGISPQGVARKALRLRKKGLPLKKFRPGPKAAAP